MIEKRGVCQGEGEEPVTGGITKQALNEALALMGGKKAQDSEKPVPASGTDLLSKMSDAVRSK